MKIIDRLLIASMLALVVMALGCIGSRPKISDSKNVDVDASTSGVRVDGPKVEATAEAGTIKKNDSSAQTGVQAKSDQSGFLNLSITEAVGGSVVGVGAILTLWLWLRSKANEDQQETERMKLLLDKFGCCRATDAKGAA